VGLEKWVNAYRSSDYIGRSLWRKRSDPEGFEIGKVEPGIHEDICVGPGAHVHYFDQEDVSKGLGGALVAREIDKLVTLAVDG
jgi:hypothetical protein